MKKLLSVLLFTILSIIIGASILSTENKNPSTNTEISPMSDAHLLSETGTLLEYHPDKNEAIVQVDNSDKRFLYDKITLVFTGPTSQYKIDSSMVGEKIKFSYFNSTLDICLIEKFEK